MASERPEQFIFVHIPKTAGTSVRTLLTDLFGPQNVSPAFAVRPIGLDDASQLGKFAVISGHISWADVVAHFPQRRLFTFLRDPIDRCLSIYGFFRQLTDRPLIPLARIRGQNNADEAISLARQLPPEDFFASDHPHVRQNVENRMVLQLGYKAAFAERVKISPKEALTRAYENLKAFAFVGFFERLAEDTPRLVNKLGKAGATNLPVTNQTAAPVRRKDVSPKTLAVIERLTELDRQLYESAWKLVEAER